jgi:hypothetical protein
MLVNKLRVRVAPEQDAEIVEPGNDALEFDAVDEEDRHGRLVLADVVQKYVLHVLRLVRHRVYPFFGLVLGALRAQEERRREDATLPDI